MRKTLVGVVARDPRPNTVRVEIDRRMRHPKYGKIIRGRTVCHVHDEQGVAKKGDTDTLAKMAVMLPALIADAHDRVR